MTTHSTHFAIAMAFVVAATSISTTHAQSVLGQRHISVSIGQLRPGDDDLKEIDNSWLTLGANVRLPASPNVDGVISLGYVKLDGDFEGIDIEGTSKSIVGGFDYHFMPNEPVNPFIGGRIGFVTTEVEASFEGIREKEDSDDFAWAVGGGIEVMLTDSASLIPTIEYVRVDDEDDFVASIAVNVWINQQLRAAAGVSYGFDDGDVGYGISVGFGF